MERRQFPRLKTNSPVELVLNTAQKSSQVISGQTVDISEGGLCFELENPLPKDTTSEISSSIKFQPRQIDTFVKLMWSNTDLKQNKFRYGAQFSGMSADQKFSLKKILFSNEKFITDDLNDIMQMVDKHADSVKHQIFDFFKNNIVPLLYEFTDLGVKKTNLAPGDIQNTINNKLDYLVEKGNALENVTNNKTISNEIKKHFRAVLGNLIYQSPVMKHALDKPYGYPGDYELLEIIYNNKEISGDNARYFDRYFLNNPYAVAVRNRKDLMRKILEKFILSHASQPKIKILNLACGSSKEIRELLANKIDYPGKATFDCVDFDDSALSFSKQSLQNVPPYAEVNFIKENILNFASKPEDYFDTYKDKDIVYSIGLADYLPDKILKKLMQFCYSLINPNGKLIIAFKDRDKNKHAPLPPGWYCDWKFVPRNKNTVLDLIDECKLNAPPIEIEWEQSDVVFFATMSKSSE